jgi:hypothetical protein
MGHELRSEDLAFLDSAPVRQVHVGELRLPADRVFDELAGHPEKWPRWFSVVRDCRFAEDPPYGVGTVRRISFRGGIVARETVLAWDASKRFAYRVEEVNVRGVRAFMEDWTLESLSGDSTRLRWVLAGDFANPVKQLFQASWAPIQGVFSRGTHRMESVAE